MRRVAVVVLGVLAALLVVVQAQTQESDEVLFEAKGVGKLAGKALSKESVVFYGLRYADSPVESLRWKAPKPFRYPADSFINATQVAPICPQKASGFGEQVQTISEDCLFVNIWVPRSQLDALNAKQKTEPLSVMVFIHGGAFVIGSGTDPYVAGEAFNERNTILVTFNYRLGPFGFFIHPALRQQDPNAFANFGLLDQKQAFRWIRENIGAFGGNPNSVTVFGESAGGMSIEWLLTSTKPDGTFEKLFDRAIIQSAPVGRALSNEHALDLSHQVLERSGWTDPATINSPQAIEWLRAQPIDTILNSVDGFGIHRTLFWHTSPDSLLLPTVDGKQFPEDPRTAFEDGKHWAKGVDVVIGTTRDEGTLFMFLTFALSELTQDHYEDGIRTAFNVTTVHEGKTVNAGDVILKQYENIPPLNPGKTSEATPLDKVSAVINDFSFQCGTDRVAKAISRDSRVYKYLFNHMAAGGHQNIGVYHAADLPFFFRTTPGAIFLKSFTDEELALSNLIIDQLVSFAATGSFTDAVSWPVFTAAKDATLVLELPQPRVAVDYKKDTCTFWNNLLPHGPPYEKADTMKAESLQSWILNAVVLRTLIMYGKYIKPLVIGAAILIVIWILRCCFFRQKKKPVIVAAKASKKRA